jgi:hypothetical protein
VTSVAHPPVDVAGDDRPAPDASGGPAPGPGSRARRSSAWRWAALFVLPYVLVGLAWVFSNPPGAAPDEPDHLVKALGMARLDIGAGLDDPLPSGPPLVRRNQSISRRVDVPARLAPDGYSCFAFRGRTTAACLADAPRAGSGTVTRVTPIGAYPPFGYVAMGLAARATGSPDDAFRAARLVALLTAAGVVLVGVWALVRELGRAALLGALVALTPMAVFAAASVTTSGLEIAGGFALGAIVVACVRRPDALLATSTQVALAGVGSVLVLSRQTGIVEFGVLAAVLAATAWRQLVRLVREHRPVTLAAAALLAVSAAALAWWERAFDHPADAGSPLDAHALRPFLDQAQGVADSAVGIFGWLDTPLPTGALRLWLALAAALVVAGLIVGTWRDRAVLGGVLAATAAVAFTSYAVVFFPVGATSQGRHLLPLAAFCPLYAGVVVVERLRAAGRTGAIRGLLVAVAAAAGALQLLGLFYNGRRYAVGIGGPLNFLGGTARWSPPLGWTAWLIIGLAGAVVLVAGALAGPLDAPPDPDPVGST